ncbi:TIM barrel protein [Archaeoglobus profundus]|uniref:Xylose isomerase domain protein TIM barrel n=1 Tax=Archaeoglobus profundus (strain DSM 5631 / JCM 9629 / NBRC 100127 / Av18) TaxID=572546 RepID=D2RGI8_ARCPA|nr:TIM barrel protein [Archaeoglobus profundus]ADB57413.1 Xylose isomerase domain protein TIM barrel [Archaeoglobus profundus DSM 5631]
MALFDWGTYNGKSKLHVAELLGMRLTEIPPYDFVRRKYGEEYFREYAELSKAFVTVTAHAPYYSTVSEDDRVLEGARRGLISAAKKAEIANAEIFNLHLGGKLDDLDRTIEIASETIREILKNTEKIKISLETTYSKYLLGSLDEIKAIMETLNSERVILSLQLENDWMREKEVYRTGLFSIADKETDEAFWYNILKRALNMCPDYLSLRFAQVTGVKLRGMVVKKRVPLGMGHPNAEILTKALAKFIIKEIHEEDLSTEIHLIYTGLPENKYVDCVKLYSMLANELVPYLQ